MDAKCFSHPLDDSLWLSRAVDDSLWLSRLVGVGVESTSLMRRLATCSRLPRLRLRLHYADKTSVPGSRTSLSPIEASGFRPLFCLDCVPIAVDRKARHPGCRLSDRVSSSSAVFSRRLTSSYLPATSLEVFRRFPEVRVASRLPPPPVVSARIELPLDLAHSPYAARLLLLSPSSSSVPAVSGACSLTYPGVILPSALPLKEGRCAMAAFLLFLPVSSHRRVLRGDDRRRSRRLQLL